MPESLRMRPFRNKGDVKRMMQRLFGNASVDSETFDPITLAAMLTGRRFPGAFVSQTTAAGAITEWPWFWWNVPAGALIRGKDVADATTFVHPRFWNPGKDVHGSTLVGTEPPDNPLTGWLFEPEHIIIRFFTAAYATKSARVENLFSYSLYESIVPPAIVDVTDPRNLYLLGKEVGNVAQPSQVFARHPAPTVAAVGKDTHGLFPIGLVPGQVIIFDGISGIVATDILRFSMTGHWIFSPRFIEAPDERNG